MAPSIVVGYAQLMRVKVLFFGMLREAAGDRQESLEIDEGTTVAGVLNVYKERMPAFGWDAMAVAVNQEYARATDVLRDGDEVALLPPVSGGLCEGIPQGLKPLPKFLSGRDPRLKPWGT